MFLSRDIVIAIKSWAASTPQVKAVRLIGAWHHGTHSPESAVDLALTVPAEHDLSSSEIFDENVRSWEEQLEELLGLQTLLEWYDKEGQSVGFQRAQQGAQLLYP